MVVVVEIKNREAFARIGRIVEMFPLAVEEAGNEFGESAVRRLKREVTAQKLVWRGKLRAGIKWHRQSGIGGYLSMPLEGIYLDSMRPHWVKLKRGRLIRQWAYDKGNYFVRAKLAYKQTAYFKGKPIQETINQSIYVRPHPFIEKPIQRTISDLPTIIKRHTSRVVNSRGMAK